MAEQVVKSRRASAAALLTENIRELKRYMAADHISNRLLKQKLERVKNTKEDLIAKHHNYAEKSNKDLDGAEMLDWITPRLDECIDILDEAFVMTEELEDKEKEEKESQQTTASANALKQKNEGDIFMAEFHCPFCISCTAFFAKLKSFLL